jgi:hypothetical protein
MSKRWKVVILGGGFGGLRAAQKLKPDLVDATVIDRRNYHLFQLLLHQLATGSLSPGEIATPLHVVLSPQKNTCVLIFNRRARLITGIAPADFNFSHDVSGVRSAPEVTLQ